ncbi:chemotaxis protein CheW [Marinigracilibium pacificum]|uniref:Purine-binding chemotaxis protein CheW n=1 Tax=Marinigracilibium pacificum TaxID=2729599 RepID=A0A848IW14_9BACT|nr:chemotaxis protein CheW [Marinigracilibium pacificum]NMM47431.1 purine-binding chemotaxis protein CheW [Marinigracilibium pacificum]
MESNMHLLLFATQKELFGLNVEHVNRVVNLEQMIKIPKAPTFVVGAINLEGRVIPIVDLAQKIELGSTDIKPETKVIILEISRDDEIIEIGVLIDEILDVIPIDEKDLSAPPLDNMGFDTDTLDGMYKTDDKFYMIIGVSKLFRNEIDFAA